MKILLREIDKDNWREVIRLKVHKGQEHFVASNLFSLAEAYVKPDAPQYHPMAIYHKGQIVGFTMYACDPESSSEHWISRFMIDKRYQGQGLGRAAMVELLKLISRNDRCRKINLCVNPDNTAAQELYKSLGFTDTGSIYGEELVFSLRLDGSEAAGRNSRESSKRTRRAGARRKVR
jgi:diamine N-acetyltransferase